MKVLVTGGAGFIGSNLIKRLTSIGYQVDVIDSLSRQVHGDNPEEDSPTYKEIKDKCNFLLADASDKKSYDPLIGNHYESIVCLAAETGTGQSMYEAEKYCNSNIISISVLNDLIVDNKIRTKNIVLASSRSVYGDARIDVNGQPIPSSECDPVEPRSIYAATKLAQENLILAGFRDIPALIFRFQNVFGPGQSLVNPYTGILSIFTTSIRNKEEIKIFEDGMMSRDFVFIDDIVDGLVLGMNFRKNEKYIVNLGSGKRKTVLEVLKELGNYFDDMPRIEITGKSRTGDIRHNFADLKRANQLGYFPKTDFETGISRFVEWAKLQPIKESRYCLSLDEMRKKGLLK